MGVGRQRTFDKEAALDKAMALFWTKGFHGTSMSDLTASMGINKPSLYAAYGNKEALFISALHRYAETFGPPHFEKLTQADVALNERIVNYLESVAQMVSDANLPGGCFAVLSTCEANENSLPEEALQAIFQINETSLNALSDFFKAEQARGNVPLQSDAGTLADYLLSLQFGLAVMARNGAEFERLARVIRQAAPVFCR